MCWGWIKLMQRDGLCTVILGIISGCRLEDLCLCLYVWCRKDLVDLYMWSALQDRSKASLFQHFQTLVELTLISFAKLREGKIDQWRYYGSWIKNWWNQHLSRSLSLSFWNVTYLKCLCCISQRLGGFAVRASWPSAVAFRRIRCSMSPDWIVLDMMLW